MAVVVACLSSVALCIVSAPRGMSTTVRFALQRRLSVLPAVVASSVFALLVNLDYPPRSGFLSHTLFRYFAAASSASSAFTNRPRYALVSNVLLLTGLILVNFGYFWQAFIPLFVLAAVSVLGFLKAADSPLIPLMVLGCHYSLGVLFCYILWEVTPVVNEQDNICLCYFETLFPSIVLALVGVVAQSPGVFIVDLLYICLLGLQNDDIYVAVQGTSCLLVILGVYVFYQVYVKAA